MEPQIRDAFLAAIQSAKSRVKVSDLIEAIDAGDIRRAVDLLRIDQGLLFPLDDAVRAAFIAGGSSVGAEIPASIRGAFGFNGRHPRAEELARSQGARLVQGIADYALAVAQTVISEGIAAGTPSRALAREIVGKKVGQRRIGGLIGLTEQQAESVRRAKAGLASGEPEEMRRYLGLKQRDARFDGIVKRAIRDGRAVSASDIAKISEAHAQKSLTYRGRVVARNEAHVALAAGRDEGYAQVAEADGVETVTRRWQHNLSENPREDHVAMDGTTIGPGETFSFPGGVEMKHPHDPAGGAEHSIGCRCIAVYRVELERE